MAKTKITYKLWKTMYDCATDEARGAHKYIFANADQKGSKYDNSSDESEPVTKVSWRDIVVWCNAYTEMTDGNDTNCVYRKIDKSVLRNASKTYIQGSETYYEYD